MKITRAGLFQVFKYVVYANLLWAGSVYFFQGVNSADFLYEGELGWYNGFIAYSAVIDTGAWIVLLFILELETYILDDEVLTGIPWFLLNSLAGISWFVIFGAAYAYAVKLGIPWGFEVYAGVDPCLITSQDALFAMGLDDYTYLNAENCVLVQEGALFNSGENMFTTPENFDNLHRMVWVDIVNAGVWLLVVALLQFEVIYDTTKASGPKVLRRIRLSKFVLYGILFVCAYYWARLGDPVVGWDALVWLVAFFFIENNMANWEKEIQAEHATAEAVANQS